MLSERLTASAIGARTARACDGCMIRRARFFCASDDAFLCHGCDTSVHSANLLASRHERVRISSASQPLKPASILPEWHQNVMRRARTPRSTGVKAKSLEANCSLVVPEVRFDDELSCDNEIDLMAFQVPVGFWNEDESASVEELHTLLDFVSDDIKLASGDDVAFSGGNGEDSNLCDFELEMLDCNEVKNDIMKMEGDGDDEFQAVLACQYDTDLMNSGSRESLLDWDFGFECDEMGGDKEEGLKFKVELSGEEVKRMLLLKLNCEDVVSAWDDHVCPWVDGTRPEFDTLGDDWPQFMGTKDLSYGHGTTARVVSEERVARVTRYREKRRTRLFSKKIRYEVRKLNAEKRPRMKGRFCKRVQSYVGPQVTNIQ